MQESMPTGRLRFPDDKPGLDMPSISFNKYLDDDMLIISSEEVDLDFHARFSAHKVQVWFLTISLCILQKIIMQVIVGRSLIGEDERSSLIFVGKA